MNIQKILLFSLSILTLGACKSTRITSATTPVSATHSAIIYHGRTVTNDNKEVELITAGAFAEWQFSGNTCTVSLGNQASPKDYNYVSVELDGEYMGRLKVESSQPSPFTFKAHKTADWHQLRIFKATEAQNGLITVKNVSAAKIRQVQMPNKKSIEFIGNSITCGMGNDAKEIPCGNGSKWYDQHNAYYSYATQVARSLNVDFTLSSISGAGIYRNWNSDGPTVPQQYAQTYLKLDSIQKWHFKNTQPDIVSIALGTNDLSNGDGKNKREPFDETRYVDTYIEFIKTIFSNYPSTQIVLLNSPMITGERGLILASCLKKVQAKIAELMPDKKKIKVFEFKSVSATGCSGHPNIEEHTKMAQQLLPFMQQVLAEQ